MKIFKRIFLFLIINFLVITMISVIISIFNLSPFIKSYGIDPISLLIFCLIWGMGGAVISLLLSKKMAKWLMKIKIISNRSNDPLEKKIYEMVEELCKQNNFQKMPEVGIYDSKEVNAFATGPSKSRSLVAISSALANNFSEDEIKAVLAHEVSHIENGDMVTMTLLQGITNAFVMFLARILAYIFAKRGRERGFSYLTYYIFVFIFQTVFMILGTMVIAAFSRYREYSADKDGAHLVGNDKMIKALERLKNYQKIKDPKLSNSGASTFNIFKISNFSNIFYLFSSHPPLDKRIERLKNI